MVSLIIFSLGTDQQNKNELFEEYLEYAESESKLGWTVTGEHDPR